MAQYLNKVSIISDSQLQIKITNSTGYHFYQTQLEILCII